MDLTFVKSGGHNLTDTAFLSSENVFRDPFDSLRGSRPAEAGRLYWKGDPALTPALSARRAGLLTLIMEPL